MQEVHINVEEVIKDYSSQVAELTSAAVFARAEKSALITRIEELEGQNEELQAQLVESQNALEQVLREHADQDVPKEERKVIEGEIG
jgi:hypothetical protein